MMTDLFIALVCLVPVLLFSNDRGLVMVLHGMFLGLLPLVARVPLDEALGLPTNTANFLYAGAFTAMALVNARWGTVAARELMRTGLLAMSSSLLIIFLYSQKRLTPENSEIIHSLRELSASSMRVIGASYTAYVSAVGAYLWCYWTLIRAGLTSSLWRYLVAVIIAQAVDSFLFFGLAFAGEVPAGQISGMIVSGLFVKIVFHVCTLPLWTVMLRRADASDRSGFVEEIARKHDRRLKEVVGQLDEAMSGLGCCRDTLRKKNEELASINREKTPSAKRLTPQ